MAGKEKAPTFNQLVDALRAESFEVASSSAASNAVQVSKNGVAAILAPSGAGKGEGSAAALVVTPGILVKGEIARLLDRGYQKFIKTSKMEIPATADHLRSLHEFSEELNEVIGGTTLYNKALGTTSDVYHYDRVQGRE